MIKFIKYTAYIFVIYTIFNLYPSYLYANPLNLTLDKIDGLSMSYTFSFWFAKDAVTAEFKVQKLNDINYIVTLEGRTKGFIGFILSYREDKMVSYCSYDSNKGEFIPKKFIKETTIRKDKRNSAYIFDYKNKHIIKDKVSVEYQEIESRENSFEERSVETKDNYIVPLPEAKVEDYLTAALNFMIGYYSINDTSSSVKINLFPESNPKKRNRVILVKQLPKEGEFYKFFINLDLNFISDKIKKVFLFSEGLLIPELILIPTGTILGEIKVERIK